jgi:hypothetical protein
VNDVDGDQQHDDKERQGQKQPDEGDKEREQERLESQKLYTSILERK